MSDTDNVFTDFSIIDGEECRYVQFTATSIPDTGANGVISVSNWHNTIIWSWHIWAWPYDLTPIEITNSTGVTYKILPVNLATKLDTADSINKTTGWKNWFYQFGRPTPMLCPSAYNSASDHANYGSLDFSIESIAVGIQSGIMHPNVFYKYSSSYNCNWFKDSSEKALNLWDAACTATGKSDNAVVKTVYDPCPVGFHVPNGNTFSYFSTSNVVGSFNCGYKFKRNSSDSVGVFFPASGSRKRTTGVLENVGSYGSVWTSASPSLNYPAYLRLYSGSVTVTNNYRAFACSIRPVQE